jgi:hypothetical protein
MNRDERSSSNDPTSEAVSDQSAKSASGPSGGPSGPGVEGNGDYTEEVVNRNEPVSTPRRYEQPIEDDGDPVMPTDDSTLNTKI